MQNVPSTEPSDSPFSEAIRILSHLYEGRDPISGEPLPLESPYQTGVVVRSLRTALDLLGAKAKKKEEPSLPGRTGERWTPGEDKELAAEFDSGLNYRAVAQKHQRTYGAILSRLAHLGKIDRETRMELTQKFDRFGEAH